MGDTERPLIRQRGEGRRVAAASQLSISLMLAGDGSGVRVMKEISVCYLMQSPGHQNTTLMTHLYDRTPYAMARNHTVSNEQHSSSDGSNVTHRFAIHK